MDIFSCEHEIGGECTSLHFVEVERFYDSTTKNFLLPFQSRSSGWGSKPSFVERSERPASREISDSEAFDFSSTSSSI